MKLHTIVKAGVGAALMTALFAAQAAPTYCSGPGTPTGITVNNMTLNGIAATDCYGPDQLANNSTAADVTAVNSLKWGGGFTFLARDENNSGTGTGTYMGLQFTLNANSIGANAGTYTLTIVDTNGGAPLNLPATLDLVGILKAGTDYAAYFFDDITVNAGNNGTYTIAFTNGGGQLPGLSHLDLLVRGGTSTVPEPATAGLLGLGLLGLLGARRRKQGKQA
jgi:hypothetical protein